MNSQIWVRLAVGIVLGAALSASALAQYGGGGTAGGMGTTANGVYTPPKGGYSSSTGIAIGAAAAAGVGIAYLVLRNRGAMTGCVEESSNGTRLVNEKDNKTYSLNASGLNLKVGDRVKLRGKKLKASSSGQAFEASKLVKDYGSCHREAALQHPTAVSPN